MNTYNRWIEVWTCNCDSRWCGPQQPWCVWSGATGAPVTGDRLISNPVWRGYHLGMIVSVWFFFSDRRKLCTWSWQHLEGWKNLENLLESWTTALIREEEQPLTGGWGNATLSPLFLLVYLSNNFASFLSTKVNNTFLIWNWRNGMVLNGLFEKHRFDDNCRFLSVYLLWVALNVCCNALFSGLLQKNIAQLQLLQNSAAGVLTKTRKDARIILILKSLHWLPVCFRIDFKFLLLAFKARNGLGPTYLSDLLLLYEPSDPLVTDF